MKDETLDTILDALSAETYSTKYVLRMKTALSWSAIESGTELLLEDEEIEKIYVKTTHRSGRADVAYRKIE